MMKLFPHPLLIELWLICLIRVLPYKRFSLKTILLKETLLGRDLTIMLGLLAWGEIICCISSYVCCTFTHCHCLLVSLLLLSISFLTNSWTHIETSKHTTFNILIFVLFVTLKWFWKKLFLLSFSWIFVLHVLLWYT